MVGGTVIEGRDVLRLWCMDKRNGDELAVYADPDEGEDIKVGDEVWWQGDTIYWTDQERVYIDRPVPKIGYSFNPRNTA